METNNSKTLLEIKNLTVQFKTENGYQKAINDISFHINKGESIGIVGESGSGKSVTSLSVMQLLPSNVSRVTSGEIILHSNKFGSIDLLNQDNISMRKIRGNEMSMIFQEPMTSLNPVFKCGDQVMESILLHSNFTKKQSKEIVIELFDLVKLPNPKRVFESYPHELSGGQKQRVMISMAMACNPSLLIADEPTTALDVTVQKKILELMRNVRDDIETSIIFITHDLGVVAEIADRVIVMYKGHIVEQGTTFEIFQDPKHPYTKGLLACRPRLDMNLKRLPVVSDFMRLDSKGNIVERKDYSIADSLNEKLIGIKTKEPHTTPLFEVNNLSVHFNKDNPWSVFSKNEKECIKAVDEISFTVYEGETLGLVGESGCGKTTLGRTILGLVESTNGDILYKGRKINNLTRTEMRAFRKDLQIIFQDPYSSLNPRKTIGDAITEPMKVHKIFNTAKERKAKALQLLEKVGLSEEHFNRYPHEFSGGQRQRVSIARALAVEPKFIICDESVSALDVSVQAQVLNLLNELKEEFGLTYIFVSHDLSVVKFMADRIMVMNKGKIEEIQDAENVYLNPTSEYTKSLIDAIPQGRIEDIQKNTHIRKPILT